MAAYDEERIAIVETQIATHKEELNGIRDDLRRVTDALWVAVEALRARPQIHPIATTIISVLTGLVGALLVLAIR